MSAQPSVATTGPAVVWIERFSCHTAEIGRVGALEVGWEKGGYHVRVFGHRLNRTSPSADDGKARAIKFARQLLAEAAAALDAAAE